MQTKVSVVVPCYQVEKYIHKCVASILSQDFNDFEIILVDDGSTDRTAEICDKYGKEYSTIKVIHKENGGLSDARNEGLKYVQGEYVCFVDSDDHLHPLYLKLLYEAALKEDADVVVCAFKKVHDENPVIEQITEYHTTVYNTRKAMVELISSDKLMNYAWNKIYKATLFDNVKYPKGRKWEDLGTTYKIIDKCTNVAYIDAVLYFYLQRADSISGIVDIKNCFDIFDLALERYEYLKYNYPELTNVLQTHLCLCCFGCWSLLQTTKCSKDIQDKAMELVSYLNANGQKQIAEWHGTENEKRKLQMYFHCKWLLTILIKLKRLF